MAAHPSSAAHRVGTNLLLSSVLALLSYVPFEWVAKATLLLCIALFIFDPIPPLSRLLSLIATLAVAALSNLYRRHQQHLSEAAEFEDHDDDEDARATEPTTAGEQKTKKDA